MQPRRRRWTRAAGILAGIGALAFVAVWAVVSVADSITAAAAAQQSVQIVASGTGSCTSTYCFAPSTVSANPGDSVTWTNTTGAPHTITRCTASACSGQGPGSGGDSLNSPTLSGTGSTFNHTFSSGGTYFYYCSVHGYGTMHGVVTVSGPPPTPPPTSPPTPPPTHPPTPRPTPPPTPRPTARPAAAASAPVSSAQPSPSAAAPSSAPLAVTLPSGAPAPSPLASTGAAFSGPGLANSGSSAGGTPAVPIVVALLVLAALAGAGVRMWRRRRPTS